MAGQSVRISQDEADRLAERYADDPEVQAQLRGTPEEPEAAEEESGTVPAGTSHWDTIESFLQPPAAEPEEKEPEPEPAGPPTPFADAARRPSAPERVHLLNAGQPVGRLASQIAALPTPGGLLPWIAVLLVLTFALVAVNGKATRLELLWRGLTGGAQLPYDTLGLQIEQEWQHPNDPLAGVSKLEQDLASQARKGFWSALQAGLFLTTGENVPLPSGTGGIGAMGTTADGAPLGPLPAAGMFGDWGRMLGDGSGLGEGGGEQTR